LKLVRKTDLRVRDNFNGWTPLQALRTVHTCIITGLYKLYLLAYYLLT